MKNEISVMKTPPGLRCSHCDCDIEDAYCVREVNLRSTNRVGLYIVEAGPIFYHFMCFSQVDQNN